MKSELARQLEVTPPRRILIVMLSAIGDAVQVLPVANALRRHWPGTRISWLIQPVPHLLVRGHPAIDEFILFRRGRGVRGWEAFAETGRALRDQSFDLMIGLQVYFKAGVLQAMAPARIKLGFDRARARDLNWLVSTHRIPAHPRQHIQDQYFEFLTHLGVPTAPAEYGIPIEPDEIEQRERFLAALDRPLCSVVVGTSKREKNWNPEGYAAVVDHIEGRLGLRTALVGGNSRAEREIADGILARTRHRPLDLLGNDLRRLVWLLSGSRLVLSPDTGPLHIARALEVPVVGLYGYTNPLRSGPWRRFTEWVVDGYAEYPGEPYGPGSGYRDGMRRITPEAVIDKVEQAVAGTAGTLTPRSTP